MRHVRQILALLLTLTLLLSVAGMAETATQGTATPAVETETEFVQGEVTTEEGTTDEGTTDEGTTDEGEALAEPIDDIASELMPVIYNPKCKHEKTKAVDRLNSWYSERKVLSYDDKQHIYMHQRITGRVCVKCGAFTEFVAGEYVPVPPEKHSFYIDNGSSREDFPDVYCSCGYHCHHTNAITYRWENLSEDEADGHGRIYVSETQHKKPVGGRKCVAAVKCKICGLKGEYIIATELQYELEDHIVGKNEWGEDDYYADGSYDCWGCGEWIGQTDHVHDFQPTDTETYCDTYSYVNDDICRGKGIHTVTTFRCKLCEDINNFSGYSIETYDQDGTQDYPHTPLGYGEDVRLGACKKCGGHIECEHENICITEWHYSDIIASLGPVVNNGNETHSGKMIEQVRKYCYDCGYSYYETRVIDGTQACLYNDHDDNDGTMVCNICGVTKRVILDDYYEENNEEFSCPHGGASVVREIYTGGGEPEPDDDETHTYPYTVKTTTFYCPICGYWDDEENIEGKTLTEPHKINNPFHFSFDSLNFVNCYSEGNYCSDCYYYRKYSFEENECSHEHTAKDIRYNYYIYDGDSDLRIPFIADCSDVTHSCYAEVDEWCEDCGALLSDLETRLVTEPHNFDATGICTLCKYVKGGLKTYPVTQISLSQKTLKLDKEQTATLTATVTPDYATVGDVIWASDRPEVATVENGTVHALSYGVANISCTATDGSGIKASCKVTVAAVKPQSVTIETPKHKINIGETLQLDVKFKPENAASSLTWKSFTPKVATVDASGLVTGVSRGNAVIAVATANGKIASVTIRVVDPSLPVSISIDQQGPVELTVGEGATLTATILPETADKGIKWLSSDPKVATVDPGSGIVTPLAAGRTIITAKAMKPNAAGKKLTATVKVKVVDPTLPTEISLDKTGKQTLNFGETLALTATLEPADTVQSEIKWISSDNKIATVDGTGLNATVTPVAEGVAVITAKAMKPNAAGQKLTATVRVKVVNPYKPSHIGINESSPVRLTLGGEGVQLTTTLEPEDAQTNLKWASSNPKVASVDTNGFVTPGRKAGRATITVKTTEIGTTGQKLTASIVVKVIDPKVPTGITLQETGKIELPNGETLQLHAIVTPDTAIGDKLTWTSSDRTIAKVNQDGLVTAKKKGTVKITVKTSNGLSASVKITVVKPSPAPTETPAPAPTEAPSPTPTEAPTETPSPTPESTPTPAPTEAPAQQPEDEPSAEAVQEPTPEPAPEQAPEPEPEPAPSTEQATGPAAEPAPEPAVDVPEAQTEELTETTE